MKKALNMEIKEITKHIATCLAMQHDGDDNPCHVFQPDMEEGISLLLIEQANSKTCKVKEVFPSQHVQFYFCLNGSISLETYSPSQNSKLSAGQMAWTATVFHPLEIRMHISEGSQLLAVYMTLQKLHSFFSIPISNQIAPPYFFSHFTHF